MKDAIVTKLVADDASYGQAIDRAVAKNLRYQKSAGKTVNANRQLSSGFRNAATSVAVIDGPLGGVAGRLGSLGSVVSSTGLLFGGFGIAVAGATTIMAKAVKVGEEYERQQLKTQAQLNATGYAAGISAQGMENMAQSLALNTLASVSGVRSAQNVLMSFRGVSEGNNQIFSRTLVLAQDMASTFGGDLKSAALQLGKALEDPATGLTALRRSGVSFTDAEREMITSMFDAGRAAEAQALVLDKLQQQVGGAGSAEAGGLSGSVDTLSQRWEVLLATLDKTSGSGNSVGQFLNGLSGGLDNAARNLEVQRILAESQTIESGDLESKAARIAKPWELAMEQIRQSRKNVQQQIAQLQSLPTLQGQAGFVAKEREEELKNLNQQSEKYLQQYNRIFEQYVKQPGQDQLEAERKGAEAQKKLQDERLQDQKNKLTKKQDDELAKKQQHSARLLSTLDMQLATQDNRLTLAYEKRKQQIEQLVLSEAVIQSGGYKTLAELQLAYNASNEANYDAARAARLQKEQDEQNRKRESATSWLEELQFNNATELEQIRLKKEEELAIAREYLDQEQLTKEEYLLAEAELDKKHSKIRQEYNKKQSQLELAAKGKLYGDLADLGKVFAGEQSSLYQVLFATSKAYNIAETLMNSAGAISKAWNSAPFPANVPAVAMTSARTGALSAVVQGVQLTGMAHDGITDVPREGTWLLDRGERVVDSRTNEDLKNYLSNTRPANQPIQQITFAPQIMVESGASQEADAQFAEEIAEQAYNKVYEDVTTGGAIRTALGG